MKLKIEVEIVYPNKPPTDNYPYGTRDVRDIYNQEMEIEESVIAERLEAIIKAFNNFKP